MKYNMSYMAEIYNEHGECFEVGDDLDGIPGLTEIRFKDEKGKVCMFINFPEEVLPFIMMALKRRETELLALKSKNG